MFFVKKRLKTKNSGGDFEKNRPTSGGYYDTPQECIVHCAVFFVAHFINFHDLHPNNFGERPNGCVPYIQTACKMLQMVLYTRQFDTAY